ncbi:hypothetical protein S83_058712, partial [Arachis hypogaea]
AKKAEARQLNHLTTASRAVRHSPPPRRQKHVHGPSSPTARRSSLLVAPVTLFSARRSGLPLLWSGLCSSLFSARRSGHPLLCSSLRSPSSLVWSLLLALLCSSLRSPSSLLVAPVSLFSALVSTPRSIPPAPGFSRPASLLIIYCWLLLNLGWLHQIHHQKHQLLRNKDPLLILQLEPKKIVTEEKLILHGAIVNKFWIKEKLLWY